MEDKICLVIDSACDVSPEFMQKYNIAVLPISLRFADYLFKDTRDTKQTLDFYKNYLNKKSGYANAETQPFSIEQMSSLLDSELIEKYNAVQVITINASRSKIYDNTAKAAFINQPKFKKKHKASGSKRPFRLRVLDSHTMFTGQAVLVHEAARLMFDEKQDIGSISKPLEEMRPHILAYLVPNDLFFIHTRASKKGDNSVSWFSYKLGSLLNVKPVICCYKGETKPAMKAISFNKAVKKLFDHAKDEISYGLRKPFVAMSYGGDLKIFKENEDYQDFIVFCQINNIETMLSIMSTTAAINIGPGSFSLAFVSGSV